MQALRRAPARKPQEKRKRSGRPSAPAVRPGARAAAAAAARAPARPRPADRCRRRPPAARRARGPPRARRSLTRARRPAQRPRHGDQVAAVGCRTPAGSPARGGPPPAPAGRRSRRRRCPGRRRQVRHRLALADEQAGEVVQERQVTHQRERRAAVDQRGADGGRDRAVDAGDAPVGQHGEVAARHRQPVDVAHRRGGPEHQQRARPAAPRPCRAPAGPRSAPARRPAPRRPPRPTRAARRPLASRRPRARPRAAEPAGARARPTAALVRPGVGPARGRRRRSPPDARDRPAAPRPAGTASGARPRPPGRAGARPASPRRPSSSAPPRSAPGDPTAPLLGSATTGQPRRPAPAGARPSPAAVADHDSVRGRPAARRRGRRRGAVRPPVHGAPSGPAGPRPGELRPASSSGSSGSRRARLRCTGPGSPRQRPARREQRLGDQRPPVAVLRRLPAGLRHADVGRPAHRAAVEPRLVDGLVRAGAPQLRRPVGGQRQQRHPARVGLQHRRVQVRGRRPGRGQHRHRPAGRLGQPERQEGRRPLVDAHVQPQPAGPLRGGQRQGDRRRPGARARGRRR